MFMYHQEEEFNNVDYRKTDLEKGEYEGCNFINCNFNLVDLSEVKFVDCQFIDCDFSNANVNGTFFQDASFENCKLLGIQFEACNPFNISFTFLGCQLKHSSFYQMQIRSTNFNHCQLEGVDFTETNLSGSNLDNCDLTGVIFENTNLSTCDFRGAKNYIIDPEKNRIKKAQFSLDGVSGLLVKYDIKLS